jgi:Xaa-Pro aminopeptidase
MPTSLSISISDAMPDQAPRAIALPPSISAQEYSRRIDAAFAKMKPASMLVVTSNEEKQRNSDNEFPFRQSSDMLYLNGFPEPHSALILLKGASSKSASMDRRMLMFVQPKDKNMEVWTGFRYGPEGALANFFATEAHSYASFSSVFELYLQKCEYIYYRLGSKFDSEALPILTKTQKTIIDPTTILGELRAVKSEEELAILRHINEISARAHLKAMLRCRPGLRERQLQATFECAVVDEGAEYVAYPTIVACEDATTLHYHSNHKILEPELLVVMDAGGEWQGYASDITRTFPVSGKFSQSQRQIYELVLLANIQCIKMSRKGSSLAKIHARCEQILRRGLIDLGLLSREMKSEQAEYEILAQAHREGKEVPLGLKDFYMHGTSHSIGLDVHDVSPADRRHKKFKFRPLKPGMVLTIEPGLYFRKDDQRIPSQYQGIGVRIEDVVAITATGNEVLTTAAPKDPDQIEALLVDARSMREARRR